MRVLLALFTLVFALGLVQKYPCGHSNWSSNDVRYSKMCYSDVPYLYTGRGFAEHKWPYSDEDGSRYSAMEYPVLISYFAWVASEITAVVPSGPAQSIRAATSPDALWGLPGMNKEVNTYFLVTAFLLFLCGLGSVFFLAGASPGRPWDAMAFAASPALLVAGLVNWDLLAVLFTTGALWAWARGRPALAGVMVGLGFATKLYPLFLLGALLVVCLRRGRLPAFAAATGAAAVTWLLVNAPAMLYGFAQWKVFWSFNDDRGADLGSLWLVWQQTGHPIDAGAINLASWIWFGAVCIAVLARPRWRDLLVWQAGEVLYFVAVWFYLGEFTASASSGQGDHAYWWAIGIRVLAELWLMGVVVRDVVAPWNDPVRADGLTDDPMEPSEEPVPG